MSPVPPSLISSPFLNAPVFNTHNSANRQPSEQDELWLRDTVPIASSSSSSSSGSLQCNRKRTTSGNTSSHPLPHSPPIVIQHHPGAPHHTRASSFTHPSQFYSPLPSPGVNIPLCNPHSGPHQQPATIPSIARSRPSSWAPYNTNRPGSDLVPSKNKDQKLEPSA